MVVDAKGKRISIQYAVVDADKTVLSYDFIGGKNRHYGKTGFLNTDAENLRLNAEQKATMLSDVINAGGIAVSTNNLTQELVDFYRAFSTEIDEDGRTYSERTEDEWAVSEKHYKIEDWAVNFGLHTATTLPGTSAV